MLLIVCPNPTLDCFATQTPAGIQVYTETPGGKGTNAGRILRQLDTKFQIVTQIGGFHGYQIRKALKQEGLKTRTFMGPINTRQVLYTWTDAHQLARQEILFPGLNSHGYDQFTQILLPYFKKASTIMFCGSLPPCFPEDSYAQWARLIHAEKHDCPIYVDARGALLQSTLSSPDISLTGIKINRQEWEDWTGIAFSLANFKAHARPLFESGRVTKIVVTDEAKPIHAAIRGEFFICHPQTSKEATNPRSKHPYPISVGGGDAFMAGFVWACEHQKLSAIEALQAGTMTAAHHYFQKSLSRRGLRDALSQVEVLPL